MIRVAVVEDDQDFARTLTAYLRRYADESHEEFKITVFADGEDIVADCRAGFDIILMDIEMAHLDGLAAAELIRQVDQRVVIIFITHMGHYAIEGYKVDALDYVLKPVTYFAFSQRIGRALARMRRREDAYLVINAREAVYRVPVSSVRWIESRGHRLIYHTAGSQHISTTKSMKQVADELRGHHFFRCNRCYLVNLAAAVGIERGFAVLYDGTKLAVSDSKRRDFLDALTSYAGEVVK
ncbi:MAG: LytTR family DNA-binding domain-containing protein [Bifidobacteriaceae bacterium]|nr:LytTR family DNA-binding domain-containing protein [Bifidobacteriaceae bacterium]